MGWSPDERRVESSIWSDTLRCELRGRHRTREPGEDEDADSKITQLSRDRSYDQKLCVIAYVMQAPRDTDGVGPQKSHPAASSGQSGGQAGRRARYGQRHGGGHRGCKPGLQSPLLPAPTTDISPVPPPTSNGRRGKVRDGGGSGSKSPREINCSMVAAMTS
ncbi:hypothetical protein B0H10DRAFT_2193314 [Mycena sp. CBHHK59/15]|nr:hypothetical protein B0H10DRAFT_2193314 [Mycena sp. CBHHK59/15]